MLKAAHSTTCSLVLKELHQLYSGKLSNSCSQWLLPIAQSLVQHNHHPTRTTTTTVPQMRCQHMPSPTSSVPTPCSHNAHSSAFLLPRCTHPRTRHAVFIARHYPRRLCAGDTTSNIEIACNPSRQIATSSSKPDIHHK